LPGGVAAGANGRRQYRLTPASLAAGREGGLGLSALESWFLQRTGHPLSAATRLLYGLAAAAAGAAPSLVLHVATAGTGDGLMQWPETRALIDSRLGPTALGRWPRKTPTKLRGGCRSGMSS